MDKKDYRNLYRKIRNSVSEKEKRCFSERIFARLINSSVYDSAETVLVYVSVGSEAETLNIIEYSLHNNKKVAVPVCIEKEMFFYEIGSLSDLQSGRFGIPTVDLSKSKRIDNFENSICVVPALCFDKYGFRIGYGGGYYDRFLAEHNVITLGITYERCLTEKIPVDKYDLPVDYILTENKLRNSGIKGGSVYE